MNMVTNEFRIQQLEALKAQLQAKISVEVQAIEVFKLQKGKLTYQDHAGLWIEMRNLNEQNYFLAQHTQTQVRPPGIDGFTLRSAQSCKVETIRMLTARLNQLRTILDKMQTNPLNLLNTFGVQMNPTPRSVQVNHLIQVNQELRGKTQQLEFEERALRDGIERMKETLSKQLIKNKQMQPYLTPSTLDQDFYSLANLRKGGRPANVVQQTLRRQPPLSEKHAQEEVRIADNLYTTVDLMNPLTMPIPTPFGKTHSIATILKNNGALNTVEYNNPVKQSNWQNFKSLLSAYSPWTRSEIMQVQAMRRANS